jgi:hypothetical protein
VRRVKVKGGFNVRFRLENLGDIELPETVQVALITEEQCLRMKMMVPKGGADWNRYVEGNVVGVFVDPDYEWPDADRSNNAAFLDPQPLMIKPSENNGYLAGAFRRQADAGGIPLVIENLDNRKRRTFRFERPVTELSWINGDKILVRAGLGPKEGASSAGGMSHYLVDAAKGSSRLLGSGVHVSPAASGRYLLINEKKGDRWKHRLLNLQERMDQPYLNRVFHKLEFIRGTDLVCVSSPPRPVARVSLYSTDEKRVYTGIQTGDEELGSFEGYGDGVFFLGRQDDIVHFYHLPAPDPGADVEPRRFFTFENRDVEYHVDRIGGYVYFFETVPSSQAFAVSRWDLDRFAPGDREPLSSGEFEILPRFLTQKGFLKLENGGTRLVYNAFEDGSETVIAAGTGLIEVLSLVGEPGRRTLYYAREEPLKNIPASWLGLSPYKRYTFFSYDFRSGMTERVDLAQEES